MTRKGPCTEAVQRAVRWLLSSNIRDHDPSSEGFGGFSRTYDYREKRYDHFYCEITGYAISLLTMLHRRDGNLPYLDMARSAGDFLLRSQQRGPNEILAGAFPYSYASQASGRNHEVYTFDTAMCLTGLTDLYAETGEKEHLKGAYAAGKWLIGQAQNKDGSFRAMYNLETKAWDRDRLATTWYGDRGCLHAKNAIGLLKLYRATGEDAFRRGGDKVCRWVLNLQRPDGAFYAKENEKYVVTHTHCYAAEGLLYAYYAFGALEFREAALRAGEWLLDRAGADGSFHNHYDLPITREIGYTGRVCGHVQRLRQIMDRFLTREIRTDAIAQAVRIWVLLYQLTTDERFFRAAQRTAGFLIKTQQIAIDDGNALGGVSLCQWRKLWRTGESTVLAVCPAMFAIHAWHMLDNIETENFDQNAEDLF